MGFRVIDERKPFPATAVSLFHEVANHPDAKPSWMSGGGVYREWMCPIYGASSEVEMMDFLYALIRLLKPALVIEGGCHLGLGSYAIGRALSDNGHGRCMTSDIAQNLVDAATARCAGLPVEVSLASVANLPIEDADVLFCDSDYDNRVGILARMKPGAVAVIHDTRQSPELKDRLPAGRIDFAQTWRGFSMIAIPATPLK